MHKIVPRFQCKATGGRDVEAGNLCQWGWVMHEDWLALKYYESEVQATAGNMKAEYKGAALQIQSIVFDEVSGRYQVTVDQSLVEVGVTVTNLGTDEEPVRLFSVEDHNLDTMTLAIEIEVLQAVREFIKGDITH